MTLAEFALLVDAEPKWVLNAIQVLGRPLPYTMPMAQQLALTRRLQRALQTTLAVAWDLAVMALAHGADPVRLPATPDSLVIVEIDMARVHSEFNVRRSFVETMHTPRRAGRPRKRRVTATRAAEQQGLDLSLLKANLDRSPAQRLRQLDGMVAFRQRVRRRKD